MNIFCVSATPVVICLKTGKFDKGCEMERYRDSLALYRNRVGIITPGVRGLEVVLFSAVDNYGCTNRSTNAIFPYKWGDDVLGSAYRAARRHLDNLGRERVS